MVPWDGAAAPSSCDAAIKTRAPAPEAARHLLGRHGDVEHAQIGLEAVADQHAAGVHQVAQLQVRAFECGQVPPRQRGVQVACNLPGFYDSC